MARDGASHLPLEGGGRAERAGGGDDASDHPTPDLRSDPPPQGEGEPRVSLSSRSKSGRPEGKGSYFAKPHLDEMGADGAVPAGRSLFRKNTLDEMTVGRTEKPVTGKVPEKPAVPPSPQRGEGARRADEGDSLPSEANLVRGSNASDDPRPIIRARPGAGSYEDPADQKKKGRTKGKTGKPGR
ncbi:hypothetical protein [Ciceribacter thiooxidans]|uniref:Excinuclease ABC subunit B n=1 Tax=Ciceribacter thiooxidans TaxID=1969821 RepID=A0ABV7I7M3_9HYPH